MILHPHGDGAVAVAQSAHALVAFQLADHWGNRLTPRPAPRAEVLAAVLVHDSGWDGTEDPPHLDPEGRPVTFATMAPRDHERIWASSVGRAAACGRYVAYLVSHHVSSLAAMGGEQSHAEFVRRQVGLREQIREGLARERRYAAAVSSPADEVNRAVLRLTDAIAVHLVMAGEKPLRLAGLPRRGGSSPITVTRVAERAYRVRPWPLVGRRLTVTAEGRLLPARRFADEGALARAWKDAPTVCLAWTLLATGAPSD